MQTGGGQGGGHSGQGAQGGMQTLGGSHGVGPPPPIALSIASSSGKPLPKAPKSVRSRPLATQSQPPAVPELPIMSGRFEQAHSRAVFARPLTSLLIPEHQPPRGDLGPMQPAT